MNINPAMLEGGEAWYKSRKRKKVRVLKSPYPEDIGRIGEELEADEGGNMYPDRKTIRIAFPEFWNRPSGTKPHDSTWLFEGEYEYVLE